jgi:hypothetical protein
MISLVIYGPLFVATYVAGVLLAKDNRFLTLSGVAWLRKTMGALRLRNKLALNSTPQVPYSVSLQEKNQGPDKNRGIRRGQLMV